LNEKPIGKHLIKLTRLPVAFPANHGSGPGQAPKSRDFKPLVRNFIGIEIENKDSTDHVIFIERRYSS
jgi:hypothetical protein